MRFDGYFIRTDLLDLPHLPPRPPLAQGLSTGCCSAAARAARPPGDREQWIVALCVEEWAWQISVSAALSWASVLLMAAHCFAIVAASLWWAPAPGDSPSTLRTAAGAHGWAAPALRVTLLAALAGLALFLPWHRSVSSPAVVELPETLIIRAECAGFVERVLVEDGQTVEGARCSCSCATTKSRPAGADPRAAQQQDLRARLAYTRQDVSSFQAESAKSEALRKSVAQQEILWRRSTCAPPSPAASQIASSGISPAVFCATAKKCCGSARPAGRS